MVEGTENPNRQPEDGEVKEGPARSRASVRRLAIGAGGLIIAAAVTVILTSGRTPSGPDPAIYRSGHNPFLESKGPSCIGMPVGNGTVVYSVDSSSALQDSFDAVRSAVGRSLRTLSTRQRFGLVIWTEGKPEVLARTENTAAGRERATELLDTAMPSGSTHATEGILAGMQLRPDTLCVIAAKGPAESDVASLARQIQAAGLVLRCLAVRDEAPTLAELARRVNGSYQRIDPYELKVWLSQSD